MEIMNSWTELHLKAQIKNIMYACAKKESK